MFPATDRKGADMSTIYGWERDSIAFAWFDDSRCMCEELPLGDYLDEPVTV